MSSNPYGLTAAGDTLLFRAGDDGSGQELWKTDGTEQGTVLVKDIRPGPDGSQPRGLFHADGVTYFQANDGLHGYELWKTDGTEESTVLVKDIRPGPDSSSPSVAAHINGKVLLRAYDGIHGSELWASEGTAEDTVLVKDLWSGESGSYTGGFTVIGATMLFYARDALTGSELWRTDGTEEGTFLVQDIFPGSPFSMSGSTYSVFLPLGDQVLFPARDEATGLELWGGTLPCILGDLAPPEVSITSPVDGSCHGGTVTIEYGVADLCDDDLSYEFDPPGGEYSGHGDHTVTLTATDSHGNEASEGVSFTIDLLAPVVELLLFEDVLLQRPAMPMSMIFTSQDDDEAGGDVVHELIKLQDRPGGDYCTIYDGWTYGPEPNGLLHDDDLQLTAEELCRIARDCGFTVLQQPEFRVEAMDCGGNVGFDALRLQGSRTLTPRLCPE